MLSYKPSVFYFRKALRAARTRNDAVMIGLHLCAELEQLKAWVRSLGFVPPRQHITREEFDAKPQLATTQAAQRGGR